MHVSVGPANLLDATRLIEEEEEEKEEEGEEEGEVGLCFSGEKAWVGQRWGVVGG